MILKFWPRLDVENLKNESFPNKTIYSSFWSVEPTDFKNVIVENIPPALSEVAEVAKAANKFEK